MEFVTGPIRGLQSSPYMAISYLHPIKHSNEGEDLRNKFTVKYTLLSPIQARGRAGRNTGPRTSPWTELKSFRESILPTHYSTLHTAWFDRINKMIIFNPFHAEF
jgi:hypothetical protein